MPHFPKLVESPHYHVWTDALHARALARQAHNKWDRGTYVRWCVTTSWTALEIACQDAAGDPSISYSFRRKLDDALDRLGLPPLNWGEGLWQRVAQLQERRKEHVHRFVEEKDLFPAAQVADDAIDTAQEAIVAIYQHVNRPVPPWTADDEDRGWDTGKKPIATLTADYAGASTETDQNLYIRFVTSGKEHTSDVLPAGTDWKPFCDDVIRRAQTPIERVRVY